jgi:hypothetical protein
MQKFVCTIVMEGDEQNQLFIFPDLVGFPVRALTIMLMSCANLRPRTIYFAKKDSFGYRDPLVMPSSTCEYMLSSTPLLLLMEKVLLLGIPCIE